MRRIALPFAHMTPAAWQNLAVAGLLLFYMGQVAFELLWGNLFGNLGSDFGAFWSAGHIANHLGYRWAYDLEVMKQVQREIVPISARLLGDSRTIPAPLLPVFLLPFQLLAFLRPAIAFAAWSLLNLAGTVLYLRRFVARLGPASMDSRLLLLCLASAPVFLNLFLGQANLWLMICVGESLLALTNRRPALAGAWLAGLLLKPQLLVLIVPALLLRRQFKVLAALALGGAALIGASWMLAGSEALSALARLWLGYAGGLPTNDIQLMMNWRMLSLHAAALLGDGPAQIILILGSLLTALAGIGLWMRRAAMETEHLPIVAVGIWAATAAVAWHSHVHSAVLLIPPLLMFAFRWPAIGPRILSSWVLIPSAAFLARLGLAALVRLTVFPPNANSWVDSLGAVAQLGVNLWLLALAVRLSAGSFALHPPTNTVSVD